MVCDSGSYVGRPLPLVGRMSRSKTSVPLLSEPHVILVGLLDGGVVARSTTWCGWRKGEKKKTRGGRRIYQRHMLCHDN